MRITSDPGETFLDRMIALVEGAQRQKTPERDRARHPARRAHHHLPARGGHACSRSPIYSGAAVSGDRADRAARLPHPDHHRRPALGDRHRRHGPPRAAQRARDVRARGGGGRRRRHAAARQDRHDHARQPAGRRVHPGARRHRSRSWPTRRSSPRSPTRRPEGRSIVVLAKEFGLRGRHLDPSRRPFVPVHARRRA